MASNQRPTLHFAGIFLRGERHQEFEREYFEVYYPLDERVPRLRQLTDSQVAHRSELYSEEELKTSVVYNNYLNRAHTQNCISVRLGGLYGLSIIWAIHDPLDDKDWSSAQLYSIRRLISYMHQYVRVRQALAGAGALGASLTELFNTTGPGIIHLDRRGQILEMNDHDRELLRIGDGLFDERGFLFARRPEDNADLQGLLKRAPPPLRTQGVRGSTIVRRESALPLLLHINPVERQSTDFRVWPVAALVLAVDPESRTRIDPAIAGEVLDLTGMESRVAVLLGDGLSVREIVAVTG